MGQPAKLNNLDALDGIYREVRALMKQGKSSAAVRKAGRPQEEVEAFAQFPCRDLLDHG